MKIMETGTSNACICKNLRHDLYNATIVQQRDETWRLINIESN